MWQAHDILELALDLSLNLCILNDKAYSSLLRAFLRMDMHADQDIQRLTRRLIYRVFLCIILILFSCLCDIHELQACTLFYLI